MIIRSAQIIGFGRWTNQKFVFDDKMQVFVGPNETGKSTLKQFIRGVLFDYNTDEDDHRINLYEPDSDSEYGGFLNIFTNEKEYQISRMGRFNSELQVLEISTGKYLKNPQIWLASVLGPVNSELFDQIFSFDQEQLNEITKLSRNELSNRLLRIGVVGSDKWLDFSKKLYSESQKKYGLNSSTRPINSLLSQYDKINKQLQSLSNDLADYQRMQEETSELERELKEQDLKIEESNARISKFSNLMQLAPAFNEYLELKEKDKSPIGDRAIDDDEVSSDELDEKISAIKSQIDILNKELSKQSNNELNAATTDDSDSSSAELELYKSNEATLRNLRLELADISNNQTKYQQLVNQYNSLKNNQEKLENKYAGKVPKAIDEKIKNQLSQSNSQNPRWMIVALTIFSLGSVFSYFRLFDPNDDRKIIAAVSAVIFFALTIISLFLSRKENRATEQLIAYGYPKQISVPTLLADQESIKNYDQNKDLIEKQKTEIHDLEIKLNKQLKSAKPLSKYFGKEITAENIIEFMPNINSYFATVDLRISEDSSESTTNKLATNQYNNLKKHRDRLVDQLNRYYASVGATDDASYQEYKNKNIQKISVPERLEIIQQQIPQEAIDQFEQYNGPDGLQSIINETQTEILKLENIKNSLQQRFSDNQAKLIRMSNDVSYQELVQDRANLQTQINSEFENYLTSQLTADWIESTLQQATGDRFPQIVKLAKTFFNYLTNGEYTDIILNRENILVENTAGVHYNVIQLSKGTSEQLYVAFRFAFAEIVSNVIQVPIIIDDGFVNFDDQRRQNAFNLLRELAQRHQIIYFTTNQSAVNIFDKVTDMSAISEELK